MLLTGAASADWAEGCANVTVIAVVDGVTAPIVVVCTELNTKYE